MHLVVGAALRPLAVLRVVDVLVQDAAHQVRRAQGIAAHVRIASARLCTSPASRRMTSARGANCPKKPRWHASLSNCCATLNSSPAVATTFGFLAIHA